MASPNLFEGFIEQLAELVAERVVQKLTAGELVGYVDQATSPLGRRRHIAAIRSGKLTGKQLGRRYIAKVADVEAFITGEKAAAVGNPDVDEVDALAMELGLESRAHANRNK